MVTLNIQSTLGSLAGQPSLRAFCLLSVRADYEFPEEDMAYAADMHGNFAQYFFASAEVFVAPVVQNATINSPSTQVRPGPLLRVSFGRQTRC